MSDKKEITVPVPGTVVNWGNGTQTNPKTKEVFDFDGKPIKDKKAEDDKRDK